MWASTALVLIFAAGCWDDPGPLAQTGSGGRGGSGGAICSACDAGGGTGGTGDATGTGGDPVGTGGSAAGTGGYTGGSTGGAAGSGGAGWGGTGAVTLQPWPSTDTVVSVDSLNQFGTNLSDLVYEPPAGGGTGDVLWGVQNSPSKIFCLLWNGTTWSSMTDDGWTTGKLLHYPSGSGAPDAEGLTRADWSSSAIYVAAERDNSVPNVSRISVLLYDFTSTATELTALEEWDLTSDFPVSPANQGIESVAWVPDSFLVANHFYDEAVNALYDPNLYPAHGGGIFFVGHETTGVVQGYVLDHTGGGVIQRVATFASGNAGVMSLDFDRDQGSLWAYCDNTCSNHASVLRLDSKGRFQVVRLYDHPTSLPNSNDEGITIAPDSECVDGFKSFFWSDDDGMGYHALYRGTIPCGPLP